jgi:hypothetical protein
MMDAERSDQQSMIRRVRDLMKTFDMLEGILTLAAEDKFAQNELVQFATFLDECGAYALANKIDEICKVAQDLKVSAPSIDNVCKWLSDINNRIDVLDGQPTETKTSASVYYLVKVADYFDQHGAPRLADKTTEVAELMKGAYGFVPRSRNDMPEEPEQLIKPRNEGALSTRYCPDHRGLQTVRVSESVYQCPVDGKMYNYNSGYVDYQGQRVPGGSVAEQTPSTRSYSSVPMRIYDSRSNILNRIN